MYIIIQSTLFVLNTTLVGLHLQSQNYAVAGLSFGGAVLTLAFVLQALVKEILQNHKGASND